MNEIRLFFAVLLPEEIRNEIAKIINKLRLVNADVKWTSVENLHITLKFLGDTDIMMTDDIVGIVQNKLSDIGSFVIDIAGIGTFGKPSNPSVIWMGIDDSSAKLKNIFEIIDSSVSNFGLMKEKRNFTAHITLGRIRSAKNIGKLCEIIHAEEKINIGSVNIKRVSLMKSDLKNSGPAYTAIKEIELRD